MRISGVETHEGKTLCKEYNFKREGCSSKDGCRFVHKCSFDVGGGRACGASDHTAYEHARRGRR